MIPTPICSIKYGINPMRLDTNATIATPLTDNAAPKAVSPTANNKTPAPIAATPTPNKAIATDNFNIVPVNGFSTRPASPITTNAPANASNALPISPRSIEPNPINTGVNTAKAAETISKAAAPNIAFFIAVIATAIISNDPASATNPLAISSHDIEDIILRAPPKITRPVAITGIAKAPGIAFFISFIAMAITVSDPARTTKLLATSSHDIVAIILRAPDRTTIAKAIVIIPAALFPIFLGSKWTAATRAPKPTTIATNPLANSSHDMLLIIFIAIANTNSAEDNFLIALADFVTFFSGRSLTAATRAPKPATIPSIATPISSRDMVLRIFNATDKTSNAADNPIIARDILPMLLKPFPLDIFPKMAIAPISSINKVVIAPKA